MSDLTQKETDFWNFISGFLQMGRMAGFDKTSNKQILQPLINSMKFNGKDYKFSLLADQIYNMSIEKFAIRSAAFRDVTQKYVADGSVNSDWAAKCIIQGLGRNV